MGQPEIKNQNKVERDFIARIIENEFSRVSQHLANNFEEFEFMSFNLDAEMLVLKQAGLITDAEYGALINRSDALYHKYCK